MKILQTKEERQETLRLQMENASTQITEKVEKYGKVTVEFDEDDFKSELSVPCGFGFQDMKKPVRNLITELIKVYDLKFYPIMDEEGFGVSVVVKKKKE